jgi:tight adherence protein B
MVPAIIVFVLVTGSILGIFAAIRALPGWMERKRLGRRLQEVGQTSVEPEATVVMRITKGPLPGLDRLLAKTSPGASLVKLIEQSGVQTTPSMILIMSVCFGVLAALAAAMSVTHPVVPFVALAAGMCIPYAWLVQRRSARLKRFEEQFPDALDLMARAIRAGHAFQTAVGMVADELPAPAGPEFKKTFDQQNFGLPLRDALHGLTERVPILDVRFFVTAVAIQRDTGGNLAEILDNLARVVRERFRIRRQVRVHTAHGRFTGYVLLGLPAALAMALTYVSPDQMKLLFEEHMGQMMLIGAIVLQAIGFVWIRQVIKIEV